MSVAVASQLRTAAWYGDLPLDLDLPENWDVTWHWPQFAPPLSNREIVEALDHPTDQLPIRDLCRGKHKPLIIVDDLNRPTPCSRVLPYIFGAFKAAAIEEQYITILVATGTHAAPGIEAVMRKLGESARRSRIVLHDHRAEAHRAGTTSHGTPVFVNPEVLKSDFIVGIGGVYPNHTAGFGGGTKLALGVLATESIRRLHFAHESAGWARGGVGSTFRKDLDEIASLLKLDTIISLQVNAEREVIRVDCGNARAYFPDAVRFAKKIFSAPAPHAADVVIANTYPGDTSLLFAKMKGFSPFEYSAPEATCVALASCPEGIGHHGLFRHHLVSPKRHRVEHVFRRAAAGGLRHTAAALLRRVQPERRPGQAHDNGTAAANQAAGTSRFPILVYRTGQHATQLSPEYPGIEVRTSWNSVVETIAQRYGQRRIKTAIYPCSVLQYINPEVVAHT